MKGFFLDSENGGLSCVWGGNLQLNYHYVTHFCFVFFLPFLYASPVFTSANLSLSGFVWFIDFFNIPPSHILLFPPTSLVQDQFVQALLHFYISKICFAILTSLFPCLRSSFKTLPPLPYCYYYQLRHSFGPAKEIRKSLHNFVHTGNKICINQGSMVHWETKTTTREWGANGWSRTVGVRGNREKGTRQVKRTWKREVHWELGCCCERWSLWYKLQYTYEVMVAKVGCCRWGASEKRHDKNARKRKILMCGSYCWL